MKVCEMNINSAQVLSLTWQWIISASSDFHIKDVRRLMAMEPEASSCMQPSKAIETSSDIMIFELNLKI